MASSMGDSGISSLSSSSGSDDDDDSDIEIVGYRPPNQRGLVPLSTLMAQQNALKQEGN